MVQSRHHKRLQPAVKATTHVKHKKGSDKSKPQRQGQKESWEKHFQCLVSYKKKHGHCSPDSRKTNLGWWVLRQRARCHRGELDISQIQRLNSIGFDWTYKNMTEPPDPWDAMFQNLVEYKKKYGDCDVRQVNSKLGKWVIEQRRLIKGGRKRKRKRKNMSRPLNQERIQKLDDIGFQWYQLSEWEVLYSALRDYYDTYGSSSVDRSNIKLRRWAEEQRQSRRKGHLSQEMIDQLDEVDFEWDLMSGCEDNEGNCPSTPEQDAVAMAWSGEDHQEPQRRDLFEALETSDSEIESGRDIESNNDISIDHDIESLKECQGEHDHDHCDESQEWEEMYSALHDHYKTFGNCLVRASDGNLGYWVAIQRQRRLKGEMIDAQIEKLDEIEFEWGNDVGNAQEIQDIDSQSCHHDDDSASESLESCDLPQPSMQQTWEESFQDLCEYWEKHGHCSPFTKKTKLGRWVGSQRRRYWRCELSDSQIMKLNSIGFVWRLKKAHELEAPREAWEDMFQQLKEYLEIHGHCSPNTGDTKLGGWVASQRSLYRQGLLHKSQIRSLNSIGFVWGRIDAVELLGPVMTWNDMFQQLVEYRNKHGHCNVRTLTSKLGRWVQTQRTRKVGSMSTTHPLDHTQIAKLEGIGFQWRGGRRWEDMYLQLANFYEEHGHTRVLTRSGKLGNWVKKQRDRRRNGLLTRAQIERLDTIDMVWKVDNAWQAMYEKLKEYQAANGDCLVPQSEGKLRRWVESQRRRKKRQVRRQKKLTQEQVQLLDDIGFAWSGKERFDEIWEQKFTQLEAFAREHGHCKVPRRRNDGNIELSSLAQWVTKMRGIHKGTRKGTYRPLSEDQTQRLEALGCFYGIQDAEKS